MYTYYSHMSLSAVSHQYTYIPIFGPVPLFFITYKSYKQCTLHQVNCSSAKVLYFYTGGIRTRTFRSSGADSSKTVSQSWCGHSKVCLSSFNRSGAINGMNLLLVSHSFVGGEKASIGEAFLQTESSKKARGKFVRIDFVLHICPI
jgi:hypothetical protein